MAELRCIGATCRYGEVVAVDSLDLHVEDGRCVALHGPAGSGKTSTLRMIAGIEPTAAGRIFVGGRDVTTAAPAQRGVAMVFGGFSASGRLTIADHIGLPLPTGADIATSAARVGLHGLGRRIKGLGAFERQLVALARAIAVDPAVLLIDEPATGLTADECTELCARIAGLSITSVYATQHLDEAAAVAESVLLLDRGQVRDTTTGEAQRARPATLHAALAFDRAMNVRRARFADGVIRYGDLEIPVEDAVLAEVRAAGLRAVTIGLSPDALRIDGAGQPVRILAADNTYAYGQVRGLSAADEPLAIATDSGVGLIGTTVGIAIDAAHVFDPATGARLG